MTSNARVKLPPELNKMPKFQLDDCIVQANLGATDTWLVRRYIYDKVPHADLAEDLGWTRSTVSKHIRKSLEAMAEIAKKLYIK